MKDKATKKVKKVFVSDDPVKSMRKAKFIVDKKYSPVKRCHIADSEDPTKAKKKEDGDDRKKVEDAYAKALSKVLKERKDQGDRGDKKNRW